MVSAFNVSISAFRNRVLAQTFTLYDTDGDPIDCSADRLAFLVLPTGPGVSGAAPLIQNTTPNVAVNVVSFAVHETETGTLTAGNPYNWQFIRSPSGSGAGSTVICAGPLLVNDSPPFP
jgi:hypothetical protein